MHTKWLWIQSVIWLKISMFTDVQGLPRALLCYYSLCFLNVLPAGFSASQFSISSSESSSQELFMSEEKLSCACGGSTVGGGMVTQGEADQL